jgi:hypothetical protein
MTPGETGLRGLNTGKQAYLVLIFLSFLENSYIQHLIWCHEGNKYIFLVFADLNLYLLKFKPN